MDALRLKSPVSRFFNQPFVQEQIKENIKSRCHWPLCGEFTSQGLFYEDVAISETHRKIEHASVRKHPFNDEL